MQAFFDCLHQDIHLHQQYRYTLFVAFDATKFCIAEVSLSIQNRRPCLYIFEQSFCCIARPVSAMIISSIYGARLFRHRSNTFSSFLTIIHKLKLVIFPPAFFCIIDHIKLHMQCFPFTLHLPVYLLYFDRYSVYPLPVPVSVRVPALVQLSVQVPVSSLVLVAAGFVVLSGSAVLSTASGSNVSEGVS